MEPSQHHTIEAAIAASPALQNTVAEVPATVSRVRVVFAQERETTLTAQQ